MRVWDEATWEADYWDEYLREFGPGAYVEARYMDTRAPQAALQPDESTPQNECDETLSEYHRAQVQSTSTWRLQ
jgi:hypothetical protein